VFLIAHKEITLYIRHGLVSIMN